MSNMIMSNVVTKEVLRKIQAKTLAEIREYLANSFGPMGSNSCIKLEKALNKYSKDGYTILNNIRYNGIIEQSVVEDLVDLTRYITITVGDGTTSAVILSSYIFEGLLAARESLGKTPFQLIEDFKNTVALIKEQILSHKHDATLEDIYNIALISTNGNKEVAENIRNIYAEYGMDVFIDVAISNSVDNLIKIYDGMTIDAGYADTCFVNNAKDNTSYIRNAKVYVFEDPIDTPEMIGLFDTIIAKNILLPYNENKPEEVVPTVILTPKLSRDMSSYMDKLAEFMYGIEQVANRPPFLVVTNIYDGEQFMDIAKLCGAKLIKKYIDPAIQEADIEKGLAPTPENVELFFGECDCVESNAAKTKFINPKLMKDENGNYTTTFNTLIEYLETELDKAKAEGADAMVTGTLKRRINSLKANMVEYLVGGVSMSDRDSLRDLVEDAVLNCRSAAANGVGFAANFEGAYASMLLSDDNYEANYIACIIFKAYYVLLKKLYSSVITDEEKLNSVVEDILTLYHCPLNLVTGEYEGVVSSIESDIIILETISKIVTLMFTCNQFIVPTSMHNVYMQSKSLED